MKSYVKGYLPGKVGCSEVSKIGLKPCVDVNKMKLPIRAFNYSLSSAQAKNNLLKNEESRFFINSSFSIKMQIIRYFHSQFCTTIRM